MGCTPEAGFIVSSEERDSFPDTRRAKQEWGTVKELGLKLHCHFKGKYGFSDVFFCLAGHLPEYVPGLRTE